MTRRIALALIGERSPSFLPHVETDEALGHLGPTLGIDIVAEWISTAELAGRAAERLAGFDALLITPGSPYASTEGALEAIRHGRERRVPTLGTCGGCQHMVIEYARNVLGFRDAANAEHDPDASRLFITPLSCSLVGRRMEVVLTPNGPVAEIYGQSRIEEEYYCKFGINPELQDMLDEGGLRIVGRDADGEARILVVPEHPFYVATLFVPQLTSTVQRPHPLLVAFLEAALAPVDV